MKAGAERILYIPPEIGGYKKESARESEGARASESESARERKETETERSEGEERGEGEGGRGVAVKCSLGMPMLIGLFCSLIVLFLGLF